MQIPARWTASQIVKAANCEFAYIRELEGAAAPSDPDAMLVRTANLGGAHERRVLDAYRREHGANLIEVSRPNERAGISREDSLASTLQAVEEAASVIFQAAVLTDEFTGYADFLVRQPDGRYRIQDTKLARSSKVGALLQLAAYADHLRELGVDVDDDVDLILGHGETATHRLQDVEPVYRVRRRRIEQLRAEVAAGVDPAVWGDARYTACGRCDACSEQVDATRDLLLVANLSVVQRRLLRAVGITTIDDLAASAGKVDGIGARTLSNLRLQAQLQLAAPDEPHAPPPTEVIDAEALAAIPEPSPGDIFFDFEGDPLYNEHGGDRWGLDYLFGWMDVGEAFDCRWAHSFEEEGVALRAFLDFVAKRRAQYPALHIYHYASYEKAHLSSLAARHGVGEDEVLELTKQGVLVDLYPIVRRAVRVGSRSYSIKKLEPLYMGDELRNDDGVTNALASVDEYVVACTLRSDGDQAGWLAALDKIAEYNAYDCKSTLRLRDWLLTIAREHGVTPITLAGEKGSTEAEFDDSTTLSDAAQRRQIAQRLRHWAGDAGDEERTADQKAIGIVAAAVEFHDREERILWGDHYNKRSIPLDELALERDVFIVEGAELVEDWAKRGKNTGRILRLTGSWAPGSDTQGARDVYLVYSPQASWLEGRNPAPGLAPVFHGTVKEVDGETSIVVRESLPDEQAQHHDLPVATMSRPPLMSDRLKATIAAWAEEIADHLDETGGSWDGIWPDPLLDVIRRISPRVDGGTLATPPTTAEGDEGFSGAIVKTLLSLEEGSYVAVQGPPGTGKTYTAGHVIEQLASTGWRIGVVAQSHKVIENALRAVADAGLPKDQIGKKYSSNSKPPKPYDHLPWTVVFDGWVTTKEEKFLAGVDGKGYVFGATAWGHGAPWDLLVVDEAGQFSLAMTAAAQGQAKRLLFLGDPQQLPQVTQASHPEPVDTSALGWIADGAHTLTPDRGYFIGTTRRMSPALTAHVSRLQYDDELVPHPSTKKRHLEGVEPGLHPVPVPHGGNTQQSEEEAAAVVSTVQRLLGTRWRDGDDERPLAQDDFIVVTPYNAQRRRVAGALAAAGLHDVPVGTVDKFQGQQAVIAIVSMAASDACEVPRGMEFLIDRNRMNVAISRAQWAAYVVHSPHLVNHLPPTPPGVALLSAFASLVSV